MGYYVWGYDFIVFPNWSCYALNDFWVWSRTHHPSSSRRHQVLMVASGWNGTLLIWPNGLINLWFRIILRRNWTNLIKSLSVWVISTLYHASSHIHHRCALLLFIESVSKWHEWSIGLHSLMLNLERGRIDLGFPWPCCRFLCEVGIDGWSELSWEQSSRLLKSMWCLTTWS